MFISSLYPPYNVLEKNDNDDYRNDNDNYDDDVNSHINGDHGYDVSTSNSHNFEPFSNFSTGFPSSSEYFTQFPGSFDEMFGKSPFRSRIFEEFNNYWHNKLHYHKSRAYQIPQRPRDPYSTDRLQRRTNNKQTRFAAATNRRSWSESDLLQEIDKDLKLAKGFLFQDEKAPSTNMFAPKFKAKAPTGTGIWSPKNQTPTSSCSNLSEFNKSTPPTPPPPPLQPVWTPQTSPQSNRKEFRPVHFESPTLPRKYVISTSAEPALPPWDSTNDPNVSRLPQSCSNLSATNTDTTNTSLPLGSTNSITTGLPKSSISEKIKTFERSASASDLYSRPQIKRLTDKGRPLCKPNEVIYNVKHEYMSEPETENERPRKMAQLGRRQYDGIGPITNDGMPIILRSEVKEPHQHEWYKRLYQTIHKQKHGGRTQYSKPNGYQSEPEPNYDSDYSTIKYRAVNPNRLQSVTSALNVRKSNDTLYGTLPNPVKSGQNSYKNQPGRIEDYVTGHSSVSEKEKKEWLKEHSDIRTFYIKISNNYDALRQLDQTKLSSHYTEGNLSRALAKESGYTSDSNLVFRKKELPQSSPLSPVEQKQAYKNVQAGGEPPLFGFRKPAPEKSKALPSFIAVESKKEKSAPPTPPNRKSLYTKTMVKKPSKGIPIPSSSSSRHEKCFKRPESPTLGAPNKYGTITLRKTSRKAPLCRSKSAGAVSSLLPQQAEDKITVLRKQTHVRAISPVRKTTQLVSSRHTSRSPVAFGRSISKERTFAEEKKRLENSLPLSRYTFEASTNILRDPALKSPQDVKKAVRTLAACAVQSRSHSVPRFCSGCRSQAHLHDAHINYLPEVSHYGYTEWIRTPMEDSNMDKKRKMLKSQSSKYLAKANSNVSLAASNSTFSLGQSPPIAPPKTITVKAPTKSQSSRALDKICKKLTKDKTKSKKATTVKKPSKAQETIQEISYVCQRKYDATAMEPRDKSQDINHNLMFEESYDTCISTVRDKTDFWNDFNMQQSASLPYATPKRPMPSYTANLTGHKSRSLSPNRNRLQSVESNQTLTGDSGYIEASEASVNKEEKEFSPTREVRVPPYLNRNVRSPSRRKIDSCRSNQTNKVIRASSLSSAEDRSKRGLYLCDELAHSATSLASNDRHSPTCRYLHNSERFAELNRFYSTLERVGQLEKCTSKTNFKPIRKESDLLDYEEWRQVRLHEKAEKELNYLVSKLKQEQQAQKFLFLPKDVNDVKWRKEYDLGLNSREKSVEDLRENFESINFLQDYIDQRNKPCCNMKYWRRNTVADLAQSLEEKFQNEGLKESATSPTRETHFSEQLVSTLPNDQIQKINQQINEIYSYDQNQPTVNDEKFVVTVEHNTMPSSSQALRVRCKSSITRDELLGSILKKKNALTSINLKKHDNAVAEQKCEEQQKKQNEECQEPPEIPPAPKMDYETSSEIYQTDATQTTKDAKDISEKIKYFEERKYETPSKTIYRAREDSSPDEDEVMKLIEEKMRLKQYRGYSQHKELSNSLTDLCGIFGEKNTSRVNFHMLSPQQRPPDESHDDMSEIYQHSEDYSPYSSMEFMETYCRSRSTSPQSQCSSYLQRVNTGEVQKIRDKFESLGYENTKSNHFFGLSKLRKVRSDPEMNTNKSESKDALNNADVSWITHKFEIQNKLLKPIKEETEPRRARKRLMLSPTPRTNRLMPHIDRISKTATLGNMPTKQERSPSPTRSLSSSSGIVERLKVRYETQKVNDIQSQLSQSSPDIRDLKDYIPQYLTANWIAHRYPSPTQNRIVKADNQHKPKKLNSCGHSTPRVKSTKCIHHKQNKDIFANQKFDPKIHTPKARYVPEGAETKKQLPRLQWSPLTPKRGHAVTFQDYDFPTPQLPPPPKGELLEQRAEVNGETLIPLTTNGIPQRLGNTNTNYTQKGPEYLHHPARALEFNKNYSAYCDITNCGKLLWVYRDPHKSRSSSALVPEYTTYDVDIRTGQRNLPYTPQPSERQAYLANQNAIKTALPLVMMKQNRNAFSPNRYYESDVNIHFKTPVRQEFKYPLSEEELAIRQAEQMQKLYQEERRRKYLQELQDMNSRRHTDNFTPSQKSPIPLNRYDDFPADLAPKAANQIKSIARALYNFQAQNSKELSFKKGDIIYIKRAIDKNWYEGEHNAMIGLFPANYVEIINKETVYPVQSQAPVYRKPSEGQARAKYNFQAQSGVELSLNKGELVSLTRRVDDNWFEGRIANRKGIFPVSYVEVLTDIGAEDIAARTTTVPQTARPSLDALRTNINNEFNTLTRNGNQPPNAILRETRNAHKTDILHVDTSSEPLVYRALYKYRPQNSDELELQEGDIVHVLEKCDDGWYVGTSQRTGCFGTFPGNYVERV
ncbi:Sorbin and SH3 domain-containing protein 1 [Lucilia cuprina]|nr:Sorbin and SH3 domain-containing protein 1 [Lucilia cuprina]